ncbi:MULTISPECIES: 3'-5' exonuclease [Sphingobium]|uniref:3'-5' exonuclease n=1 Tax=Sphingobium sp. MI1205 TaxID=407020 RepID=UPI00076FF8AE|nr:hypothetical protein [Sphingobium sp. MI1205]AMK17415.1 hypothetical protein K663_05150 [Sphingobium sp. MI1205]
MTILAIDFEASCLPRHGRSFPIEVGVAVDGWSESWLIRPHESWRGWDWTAQAQALHGLTLERLYREGLPVEAVFDRLVAAVDGRRVVADSHIDQYWLETLSRAAGEPAPFAIDHVSRLLDEYGARDECIVAAVAQADARHPLRHRAASDAAWLSTLLGHVAPGSAVPMPPIMAMQRAASMSYGNNL